MQIAKFNFNGMTSSQTHYACTTATAVINPAVLLARSNFRPKYIWVDHACRIIFHARQVYWTVCKALAKNKNKKKGVRIDVFVRT